MRRSPRGAEWATPICATEPLVKTHAWLEERGFSPESSAEELREAVRLACEELEQRRVSC
jgi:hypothetical protein